MSIDVLIAMAWKSVVVAGATLLLLRLARGRSADERSLLGHAGLVAMLILPLAPLAGLCLSLPAPAALTDVLAPAARTAPPRPGPMTAAPAPLADVEAVDAASPALPAVPAPRPEPDRSAAALLAGGYAAIAAMLLLLTVVALARLGGLRRRSQVLVDREWLTALARAQRRMGFKNGTALLVSDELASPVSWGMLRPVIVVNSDIVAAPGDAEAVIAHELAHVARFDWLKLMLARTATALFWFNPLVWLLARDCHQLREEAADDAVLNAEVADVDYARLLVGVARHEGNALLLAVNGVAPARGSLKRRVARVLDGRLRRGPVGRGWALACAAGAGLLALPLAALTLEAAQASAARPRPQPAPLPLSDAGLAMPASPVPPTPPGVAAPASVDMPDPPVQVAAEATMAHAEARADAELARWEHEQIARTAAHDADIDLDAGAQEEGPAMDFDAVSVRNGGRVIIRQGAVRSIRVLRGAPGSYRLSNNGGGLELVGCLEQCPSGAAEVEVVTPAVDALAVAAGGSIEVRGRFVAQHDLALAIRGGGSIDARDLPADEVAAAIRGGGTIATAARRELAAAVHGGGTIRYNGNPQLSSSVLDGGTIERAD